MNGCRNRRAAALFDLPGNDADALRGNRDVRVLPYVGDHFEGVLNANGYRTVDDVVRAFTGYPGLAPDQIREMLGRLCRNPSRYTCQGAVDNPYHVSDVNQCLYNSVLDLLRQAHARRDDWVALGFTVQPNVPNAVRVPFRSRGTNRMVRNCACHDNRRDCRRNRCRWTPPAETGRANGACTPIRGEGFDGKEDETDQHLPGIPFQGQVQEVDGLPYVKRYRILGGTRTSAEDVPRSPRRGRVATGRPPATRRSARLQGGGEKRSLAREKRDLAKREKALGKKDVPGRRRLNQHIRYYKNRSVCDSIGLCFVRFDPDPFRESRESRFPWRGYRRDL